MRNKILISCCGYTAALGTPADWTCTGCGTLYPAPDIPAEVEPFVPAQAVGSASLPLPVLGGHLPGL